MGRTSDERVTKRVKGGKKKEKREIKEEVEG